MFQKEFFKMQSQNAGPYPVINLTGSQKYEQNTVFRPGKYLIELAPGIDSDTINIANSSSSLAFYGKTVNMRYEESINTPFIIRAYCGSSATSSSMPGINSYSGTFKVNAIYAGNINSSMTGVDVSHIFGAGGGNCYFDAGGFVPFTANIGGGANCLGDGNIIMIRNQRPTGTDYNCASGAGSCLHLLPVGGTFGTDYIRAYHAASPSSVLQVGAGACCAGSAYGGAMAGNNGSTGWFTRGGNSPYGNGGTTVSGAGTGIGRAGIIDSANNLCCAGAYFNGTTWVDAHGTVPLINNGVVAPSSYIRVTYLGVLN